MKTKINVFITAVLGVIMGCGRGLHSGLRSVKPLHDIYGTENSGIPEEHQSIEEVLIEMQFPADTISFLTGIIKENLVEKRAFARNQDDAKNPNISLLSGDLVTYRSEKNNEGEVCKLVLTINAIKVEIRYAIQEKMFGISGETIYTLVPSQKIPANNFDFTLVPSEIKAFASDETMNEEQIYSVFFEELEKGNYDLAYLFDNFFSKYYSQQFFSTYPKFLNSQYIGQIPSVYNKLIEKIIKESKIKRDSNINRDFNRLVSFLKTSDQLKKIPFCQRSLLGYIESIKRDFEHLIDIRYNANNYTLSYISENLPKVCESLTEKEGFPEEGDFRKKLNSLVDEFKGKSVQSRLGLVNGILDLLQDTIQATQQQ